MIFFAVFPKSRCFVNSDDRFVRITPKLIRIYPVLIKLSYIFLAKQEISEAYVNYFICMSVRIRSVCLSVAQFCVRLYERTIKASDMRFAANVGISSVKMSFISDFENPLRKTSERKNRKYSVIFSWILSIYWY